MSWIPSLAFCALILADPSHTPPTLALIVRPTLALAPSDIHLTLRIARHEENRWWRVEMDAEDGGQRASAETINGENAPIVHEIWWGQIPAGDYRVMATLGGINGIRAREHGVIWLR